MGLVQQAFAGIAHNPALDSISCYCANDDQVRVQFGGHVADHVRCLALFQVHVLRLSVTVAGDLGCIRRLTDWPG